MLLLCQNKRCSTFISAGAQTKKTLGEKRTFLMRVMQGYDSPTVGICNNFQRNFPIKKTNKKKQLKSKVIQKSMIYLWLLQSPKWNQNESKIVCVGCLSWVGVWVSQSKRVSRRILKPKVNVPFSNLIPKHIPTLHQHSARVIRSLQTELREPDILICGSPALVFCPVLLACRPSLRLLSPLYPDDLPMSHLCLTVSLSSSSCVSTSSFPPVTSFSSHDLLVVFKYCHWDYWANCLFTGLDWCVWTSYWCKPCKNKMSKFALCLSSVLSTQASLDKLKRWIKDLCRQTLN